MNINEVIKLKVRNEKESEINDFMKCLDETFEAGRAVDKNLTYKQNLRNCLTVLFSTEFQPKISKELN
jgi:hypothetical protein